MKCLVGAEKIRTRNPTPSKWSTFLGIFSPIRKTNTQHTQWSNRIIDAMSFWMRVEKLCGGRETVIELIRRFFDGQTNVNELWNFSSWNIKEFLQLSVETRKITAKWLFLSVELFLIPISLKKTFDTLELNYWKAVKLFKLSENIQ